MRARGADILGQLGVTSKNPINRFLEESFDILSGMIQLENETRPLASAIYALGHLGNSLAIQPVAAFAHHPSADVRLATAFALGCFCNDPDAIKTLLELMTDIDDDVRDWATFGLGVLGSTDGEIIRSALMAQLTDPDENTREEALVGLAKRHDRSIVPTLRSILQEYEYHYRAFEAADYLLGVTGVSDAWTAQDYISALDSADIEEVPVNQVQATPSTRFHESPASSKPESGLCVGTPLLPPPHEPRSK